MEEKNIEELLSEEIAAQIEALSDLQSGSKEKSTAIDDLTKLYKLRIEENKSVWDADEKLAIQHGINNIPSLMLNAYTTLNNIAERLCKSRSKQNLSNSTMRMH